MRRTLEAIASPFREFGFLAGAAYAIDRVLARLSPRLRLHVYELMVQPIPATPLLPERFSAKLEIREIRRGDPEIDLMPARPDIKARRFEQGAICLGAFQKGKLIGYLWFCCRAYEEDEVRCVYVVTPENAAVFDFDLYLFPEHRMGLGFVGLWDGVNRYLRGRGVGFTFSRLTRFNLPSRRAHRHLGWKRVGSAIFLQAWRFEAMVATIFPYVHVSLVTSVRFTLRPDVLLAS